MKLSLHAMLKPGLAALFISLVQPAHAAVIAFYDVTGDVDPSPAFSLRSELASQGHTIRRITAASYNTINTALDYGTDILVFPALIGSPLVRMDSTTESVIRGWVSNGGRLPVVATINTLDEQLVNGFFTWSVQSAPEGNNAAATPAVEGTTFEDGPAGLGTRTAYGWTAISLPTKSHTYYYRPGGSASSHVVVGSYGQG